MLHLYHLNKSRSFRIVWLLEELKLAYGIDYQLHQIERDARTALAPEHLAQIHPMGKAPILVDDSLPAGENSLAESAVIIEYLLKTYDTDAKFYPTIDAQSPKTTGKAWRDYTFWLHFAEGSLMPPLVMGLILDKVAAKSPWFAKPIANKLNSNIHQLILDKNLANALQMVESALANQDWLAGQFSGADIQMYFAVKGAKVRGVLPTTHQHTLAWLARCESQQAYKNTEKLAGAAL
ncbi:glutathione S-transferase [Moraxella marmotae]|uniref:glutathione S-transferase n=1 Tax=Moraxella marmotae TaxID=3344520 RepID=UPI0035F23FA5